MGGARTQLRDPGVGDEDVARLEVSVNHSLGVQVLHPRRNLAAVEQHRLQRRESQSVGSFPF